MDSIFIQLALILSLACVFGFLTLRLKLPLVVAYLLAGVALAQVGSFPDSSILIDLPEIGIAFVLFLIGMELNLPEMRSLRNPVFFAVSVQIFLSSVTGYAIALWFGFVGSEAILLGVGLAFSSTVVIVKMLAEKRDQSSLYGKLSVAILLVEDLVAILIMTVVTTQGFSFETGVTDYVPFIAFLGKAIGLILFAYLLSRYVLTRVFNSVASSIELLFLTSITWCFVFTSLAVSMGFSVVIGAFIAGVALASSPYQLQIQGKIKPLRDFFVALFFVYVGSQVQLADIITSWPVVLAFTVFALCVKPLIYLTSLSLFKFRKHTLFQTALNMTQVSEFSLIILLLGLEFGLVSPMSLSVIAGAAVLSIMISSVLISNSDGLYLLMKPLVALFHQTEDMDIKDDAHDHMPEGHVIVIGADRVGKPVIRHLMKEKIPFIVLDYNPAAVKTLRADGIHTIYGDLSDPEIIEHLELSRAKLIISTASGFVDNKMLLEACRRRSVKATVIVRATEADHEAVYRNLGADYVIFPERVSGDFLVSKLEDEWPNLHFTNS